MRIIMNIKLKTAVNQFVLHLLTFSILLLVVRLFFAISVATRLLNYHFGIIAYGYLLDLLIVAESSVAFFVPFYIVYVFKPQIADQIIRILMLVYVTVSAMLTEYFCNMGKPLDHIVFMYTIPELRDIVLASVRLQIWPVLLFLFTVLASVLLIMLMRKKCINFTSSAVCLFVLVAVAIAVSTSNVVRKGSLFDNVKEGQLATNQIAYSYYKIKDYRKLLKREQNGEFDAIQMRSSVSEFHIKNAQNEYVNNIYPFARRFTDADVFGPFMRKTSNGQLPNFVFIIVESLGQKLTGVEHPSISFTPFIDSLAAHGLYWPNCLSTAERTFGALPSIFASAPYGSQGFANRWRPTPDHNSLLKNLTDNGYYASFFYGGSSSFDGQDAFMRRNGVEFILDNRPDSSAIFATLNDNNRWGFDDAEMFNMALNYKQSVDKVPFVDVYLTLSTHEPFLFNGIEKYLLKVDKMLENHRFKSNVERVNVEQHKQIFACFLYADDCLRQLVAEYKKLNQFNNTIFVIVGDHRMAPLGNANQLQKYHVPLVFFSPLLCRTKTCGSVISHLDVAPTIDAYLSHNYQYKVPQICHWLGNSFDTLSTFSCNKIMPFMLNNRDVVDYLHDTLFISNNDLFVVTDGLCVTPFENEQLSKQLKNERDNARQLHAFSVNYDYLKFDNELSNQLLSVEKYFADTVNVDNNQEFFSICSLKLNNVRNVSTNVGFRYKTEQKNATTPLLVFTIEKDGKTLMYHKSELVQSDDWNSKIFRETNYIDDNANGSILGVYLWNNCKTQYQFTRLNVEICSK